MGLLPILLVTLLVLLLMMLGAIWAMNWAVHKMVEEKHDAIEAIVDTGQVPCFWSAPFESRIARLGYDPANANKVACTRERAKRSYLKRLDSLMHYVEKSTLVDGDDTRRELLDTMGRVRAAWQKEDGPNDWDAIACP